MSELIARKLSRLIPGTHLGEYIELARVGSRVVRGTVIISHLWDESPLALEKDPQRVTD